MAEEKKKKEAVRKSTTKKASSKKEAKKPTTRKKAIKKENTVLFEEQETKEIIKNVELQDENEELKSDVKRYQFLMILLIILMLVSVVSQGLRYYAKYQSENENNKVSILHGEPLSLEDKRVLDLYSHVSMFKNVSAGNYMGYFYESPGKTVESISDEVKVYMGLSLVDSKKYLEKDNVEIPKRIVKKNIEKIFGKDVTYKDTSLGRDGMCYLSLANFNEKKNNYEVKNYNKCNGTYQPYYGSSIESASRYSNRIEIVEKAYYGEYDKVDGKMVLNVYKNAEEKKDNLVVTLDAKDLDEKAIVQDFKDMLSSYKYTFYLEKGEYYLHSVERVSETNK